MLAGTEETLQGAAPRLTALRALLGAGIDYAGLFPPASLNMETAVRNYFSYRGGDHSWMLGRFIVPLSRMPEFEAAIEGMDVEQPAHLSVILPGPEFDPRWIAGGFAFAAADAVEVKLERTADVKRVVSRLPDHVGACFEFPLPQQSEWIPAIAGA